MDNIRTIFISLYGEQLKVPNTTLVKCQQFDDYYDQRVRALEKSGIQVEHGGTDAPDIVEEDAAMALQNGPVDDVSANELSPGESPSTSRPLTPSGGHLAVPKGAAGRMSRRQRKMQSATSVASSGDESPRRRAKGKKVQKKGRKWDADGMATEDDDVQLDYSTSNLARPSDSDADAGRSSAVEHVESSTWGSKTLKGQFVLKDLDDEVEHLLESAKERDQKASAAKKPASGGFVGSGLNAISGMLRNVVGGKVLTKEDLDKATKSMEEHLLKKNVAREAAVRLCEGVEKELVGVKTGNFESESSSLSPAWLPLTHCQASMRRYRQPWRRR